MSRDSLVLPERYAMWVNKPMSYVINKINTGQLNAYVVGGKEYIKLAPHRIAFYKSKERGAK